jgi:hypothetical protein
LVFLPAWKCSSPSQVSQEISIGFCIASLFVR